MMMMEEQNQIRKFLYINLIHIIMIVTKGFEHDDDDGGAKLSNYQFLEIFL